jgi:hypothetical protein
VKTTIPAYAFVLSIILCCVVPGFSDRSATHRLFAKLSLVAVMVAGVYLLSR